MQIIEMVLYGYNGKVRKLPFSIGSVNIITGRSKSGKTAVGDIIDYCLGGNSCNIADGVVRETVSWYGLLLQLGKERIFVARKNPDLGQQTTSACHIEIGENIESPSSCDFTINANIGNVEEILSSRMGISENLHKPAENESRSPLSANIRHALFYCFQSQDEIAAKNFLFHRQAEDFITQSIKDTLPYFLGVVSEQALLLENERGLLKRKLVLEKRELEEIRALVGGGTERAVKLISEARGVGLLDETISVDLTDYHAVCRLLSDVVQWTSNSVPVSCMDRISALQASLSQVDSEIDDLDYKLEEAKRFLLVTNDYTSEARHQKVRLESIGLFDALDFNPVCCPLCSGVLEHPLPGVEAMKQAIVDLNQTIENVSREHSKLISYIDSLQHNKQQKKETSDRLKAEIDGLYEQQAEANQIRDLNARRAKVVGRISLWLESACNDFESEQRTREIEQIQARLDEIEELLSTEMIEDRKQSVLSRMQVDMSAWAKELELEHSNCPYRLDLNKATVVVDKFDRPVPLKQLGSGSNWVGVHLITYFALHKFFVQNKRPVPRFIFIDQPSQVYFPSETDEQRTDWEEVSKIYRFIAERVREFNGELQVIIVDHADLDDDEFHNHTIASWLSRDESLIPNDWINDGTNR